MGASALLPLPGGDREGVNPVGRRSGGSRLVDATAAPRIPAPQRLLDPDRADAYDAHPRPRGCGFAALGSMPFRRDR